MNEINCDQEDIDVIRISGNVICPICGKKYRDHPEDPDLPFPTFVLLCDGTHGKC